MPAAQQRETRSVAGAPSLWREGTFRAIWAGQTASLFGDQVTGLALPWLILLQTHSALAAGVVAAARYVPLVALGLAAGVVADRAGRRTLLVASDAGRALALGVVAGLGALRLAPPLWLLALVVMALGAGQVFFSATYSAWLVDVTGESRLGQANAALEASDAASMLAGYPLAGALIAAVGPVRTRSRTLPRRWHLPEHASRPMGQRERPDWHLARYKGLTGGCYGARRWQGCGPYWRRRHSECSRERGQRWLWTRARLGCW